MDFECSLQGGNFCVGEGEPDVVLSGFLVDLSHVVDQRGQRAEEGSQEDASEEIECVVHRRSLREQCENVGADLRWRLLRELVVVRRPTTMLMVFKLVSVRLPGGSLT